MRNFSTLLRENAGYA